MQGSLGYYVNGNKNKNELLTTPRYETLHQNGFSKIKTPEKWGNKTLKELGFSGPRDKYGLAILAIQHGSNITLNPDTNERLNTGDVLIIAGKDQLIENLTS